MQLKSNKLFSLKDIVLIPMFAALLFSIKFVLSFLPNIQLVVCLLIVYSRVLGFGRTSLIIIIYSIIDSLIFGGFNIIFLPFIILGWLIIPLLICIIFDKVTNNILLALIGFFASFLYCWIFLIPNVLILHIDFRAYLISDLLFEMIMACSSFLSILWLYKPLEAVFSKFMINKNEGV